MKIIKKIVLIGVIFCLTWSLFANTKETRYISPNSDGVQDELIIPLKINETRYLKEWALIIEDSDGVVVRTIGNKIALPEELTFLNFWKQLFAPKKGVDVPKTVTWNGYLDSGEVAPDGIYYYYLTASDDNGNTAKTINSKVEVDNKAPEISLTQPSAGAKIFGGGNKPSIKITQSGDVEDLWTAEITSNDGTVVKNYTWNNDSPNTVTWDGTDNNGIAVPVGVYTYKITCTDRAGNKNETSQVSNIVYDAIPRAVNMLIAGSPFSPNTESSKQIITISPSMSTSSGLVKWAIDIKDSADSLVYKYEGTETPPKEIEFTGKKDDGTILKDGDYALIFTALYNNGQESTIRRNMTVDTTAPKTSVVADKSIFNPNVDGELDTLVISQEGSKEKSWVGVIINDKNQVVKRWDFGEIPPKSITWNGVTEDGQIVDGFYTYTLSTTDLAGNYGSSKTATFELNTGETEVFLTATPDAFNPFGSGSKKILTLSPIVKTNSQVQEYSLSIKDASGSIIKTFTGTGKIPAKFTWNGMTDANDKAVDGLYSAEIHIVSTNGTESTAKAQNILLDSVYPEVKIGVPYVLFSPNEDNKKDFLPLKISSTKEDLWIATFVSDTTKEVVKSIMWDGNAESFNWDGSDEAGNIVPDGIYTFEISTTDAAGNKTSETIQKIEIDTKIPNAYITAEYDAFSPNKDGNLDTQLFSINTSLKEGLESWTVQIVEKDTNKVVKVWDSKNGDALPDVIEWHGEDENNAVAEGILTANLILTYTKGDIVDISTTPFLCTVTPPELSVAIAPEYFSPDNDGVDDELFIKLDGQSVVPFKSWQFDIYDPNNNLFWNTKGKETIADTIVWDGRSNTGELVQSASDYMYEFTVTDILGMTTTKKGFVPVDVLVIRVGDVLKIQVPSIIFRSDNADFMGKDEDSKRGLEKSVIDNNERVLKRIAEILEKFKSYNVTIEGHANNITGTEAEETSTENGNIPLVPLSEERAKFVKDKLIGYGTSSSRLDIIGMGGRVPVVEHSDRANWWKNRRVEFILNK